MATLEEKIAAAMKMAEKTQNRVAQPPPAPPPPAARQASVKEEAARQETTKPRVVDAETKQRRTAKLADVELRELRSKLRLRFKQESYTQQGADLKALFQRMDKDDSGELDLPEFAAAVRRFGIMDEQVRDQPRSSWSLSTLNRCTTLTQLTLVNEQELQSLIATMDDDGNGTIDVGEFMEFVNGEEEPTEEEVAKAAAQCKYAAARAKRKNTMSHGDWHKALRAVSEDQKLKRVAKLADADMRALRTKLRLRFKKESYTAKGADLKALFQRMDKDGSGELDLPEFAAAVRRFGIMNEQELQSLIATMDDDGNGTIDVGEFMEFVEGEEEQTLEDIAKAAVEQERARKYAERKATMKPGEWGGGCARAGGAPRAARPCGGSRR